MYIREITIIKHIIHALWNQLCKYISVDGKWNYSRMYEINYILYISEWKVKGVLGVFLGKNKKSEIKQEMLKKEKTTVEEVKKEFKKIVKKAVVNKKVKKVKVWNRACT